MLYCPVCTVGWTADGLRTDPDILSQLTATHWNLVCLNLTALPHSITDGPVAELQKRYLYLFKYRSPCFETWHFCVLHCVAVWLWDLRGSRAWFELPFLKGHLFFFLHDGKKSITKGSKKMMLIVNLHVIKHCNWLHREVAESPSMGVFKRCKDVVMRGMV